MAGLIEVRVARALQPPAVCSLRHNAPAFQPRSLSPPSTALTHLAPWHARAPARPRSPFWRRAPLQRLNTHGILLRGHENGRGVWKLSAADL